ncbi:MAG: nucleotide pyrophosphohydrolase [Gemmataceae bacterium]
MSDSTPTVAALTAQVLRFSAERDWEPFHSPKNLVMALASEVGELVEPFRWLTEEQSRCEILTDPALRQAVMDEVADVASLLLQFCAHTQIDLGAAIAQKLIKNALKYPAPVPTAPSGNE